MREFVVSVGNQSFTCLTAIALTPTTAPNINVEFLRFWTGQAANATSAQQRITLNTQTATQPTVTGATPQKLKFADPNASVIVSSTLGTTTAGAAAGVGVTATAENSGSKTSLHEDAFNVLNGWLHVPTPSETRVLPAGLTSGFLMTFPAQPATTTGWSYGLIYREV